MAKECHTPLITRVSIQDESTRVKVIFYFSVFSLPWGVEGCGLGVSFFLKNGRGAIWDGVWKFNPEGPLNAFSGQPSFPGSIVRVCYDILSPEDP
jgi:hypothetical protein